LLQAGGDRWQALVPVIVRRSGGIPLYLVSYAEELGRRGEAEPGLDLPWTVAQGVRQRVVALPENAQELLGVAAVTGRVVQADVLGHVTSRDEEDVLQALDAAVDAYLLE